MARPVKADAQATRARLVEAASVLFADRGVDGASVRQIAAAAGVSLAMVHHYFGNKRGLYNACLDALYVDIEAMSEKLEAAFDAGLGHADRGQVDTIIDSAIRAAFQFARANRGAVRLLMQQVTARGGLDPIRRDRFQAPFLDSISARLSALQGRPAAELRLPIQSATSLVVRYALSADDELAMFSGHRGDPIAAIEDHLCRAARALFAAA